MKKTLVASLAVLGLLAAPARAAEFGLLLDKEIGHSEALGTQGSGLNPGTYQAASPTGLGFRAGYTFMDLKFAELGAAVTYHPRSQDTLSGPSAGKYGEQYLALGVQADWKLVMDLHAGLDMRSEKLSTTTNSGTDSTTVTRPWVKAGVGYALPAPVLSPFVRLELAVPLTSYDAGTSTDDFRKAMAPSLQVALYGGIRF